MRSKGVMQSEIKAKNKCLVVIVVFVFVFFFPDKLDEILLFQSFR